MKVLILFLLFISFYSCIKNNNADLIIHNAKIYTVNEHYSIEDAMAIKNGKIIEVGPERQIMNKYFADEIIDAQQREIYPGFTDAHGHIISLMYQKLNIDVSQCKSFEDAINIIKKYKNKRKFVIARGWDQSLWSDKSFPDNKLLNQIFPSIPVLLLRVDGHVAIANEYLLKKAKIDKNTNIIGGKVIVENDSMTGLVYDNVINELMKYIPSYSESDKLKALSEIESELLANGITEVHEAGIERDEIELFKTAIKRNIFTVNIYAMLFPTKLNLDFVVKNGKYKYKNLYIRSIKIVADGSLGSRGACLKKPYNDATNTHGHLLLKINLVKDILNFAKKYDYQVNTHAIGDSTNKLLINLISEVNKENKNQRWRLEHTQVIDENDFKSIANNGIIPSVQPTHAVSDMRWAIDRLGKERIKGAYAYKRLLNECGIIIFGTDFPVESLNPFLTIHAAINRKNKLNEPNIGFMSDQKITLKDCIKAMTIWPAFASFQENIKGTLEKGKEANFFISYYPINENEYFKDNFSYMTFIKGKKVYSAE